MSIQRFALTLSEPDLGHARILVTVLRTPAALSETVGTASGSRHSDVDAEEHSASGMGASAGVCGRSRNGNPSLTVGAPMASSIKRDLPSEPFQKRLHLAQNERLIADEDEMIGALHLDRLDRRRGGEEIANSLPA